MPAINATELRIMPSARTPIWSSRLVLKYKGTNNTHTTINVNDVNIMRSASLKLSGNHLVIHPRMIHPAIITELYTNDNTSMAV